MKTIRGAVFSVDTQKARIYIQNLTKTNAGTLNLLGFPAQFMAFPRRFERPTYRLGGGCSILLSYGNIYSFQNVRQKHFPSLNATMVLYHTANKISSTIYKINTLATTKHTKVIKPKQDFFAAVTAQISKQRP